jgi:antitoxin component YwqK of YwqJK toxin-antitoxin module
MGNCCSNIPAVAPQINHPNINIIKYNDILEYKGHVIDDTLLTYRLPFEQFITVENFTQGNWIAIKDGKEVAWYTVDSKSNVQNTCIFATESKTCYRQNHKLVRTITRRGLQRVKDDVFINDKLQESKQYTRGIIDCHCILDEQGNGTNTIFGHDNSQIVSLVTKFKVANEGNIFDNGKHVGIVALRNGTFHGSCKMYSNNKLIELYEYNNGVKHGRRESYDMYGVVYSSSMMVAGEGHGLCITHGVKSYYYEGRAKDLEFYYLLIWALKCQLKLLGFEPQVIQITLLYILAYQPEFLRELGIVK